MPKFSLSQDALRPTFARLSEASARPAPPAAWRQPVHTVYGGAHLFKADAARKLGDHALRALSTYAPDFCAFARAIDLPGAEDLPDSPDLIESLDRALAQGDEGVRRARPEAWLAHTVRRRVVEKLQREPVEDYRIDFEDGYGVRAWDEEDKHAEAAAREVAKGLAAGSLPPFLGIRIKALTEESRARSVRTLDAFLSTLVAATRGAIPAGFAVTLPKISSPAEVAALAEILATLEGALGLPAGAVAIELMIETPRAIFDAEGRAALPALVAAADGRCVAAHFGAYDYTASLDVTASVQSLSHPSCFFARHVMQVSLAGTGVRLSDGAVTLLPIPPHKPAPGDSLSSAELDANAATVHRAWRLQFAEVTRALAGGYHQGWDLHPAQLPIRYAAVYAFFLEDLDDTAARLRAFVESAARARSSGAIFDDAATGQGLLNAFLRALAAGALREDEAAAATGLSIDELRGRSFQRIVAAREV